MSRSTATAITERRLQVAQLVKGGVTSIRHIAKALGIGLGTAQRDLVVIRREWQEQYRQERDDAVALALARLDDMRVANTNAMRSGDSEAAKIVIQVDQREAKYRGTEAPTKIDQTIRGGVDVGELWRTAGAQEEERHARVRELVLSCTAPGSEERKLAVEILSEWHGGWCGVSWA